MPFEHSQNDTPEPRAVSPDAQFPELNYFYGTCYKYRAFGLSDSKERAHLADLICGRQIMFASPSTFNDPYDCRPVFFRGSNPAEDRARIERAWRAGSKPAGNPKLPRKDVDRHVTNVMEKLGTNEGAEAEFKPYLDRGIGVFCMSRDWRLLTQWAYYADAGKGICLEYEIMPNAGFDCVFEVDYCDERPRVEITRLLDDAAYRTQALFTAVIRKARAWSHECEVRALQRRPGIVIHPENMLVAIMVGISARQSEIDWLRALLAKARMEVPLYKTKLNSRSYTLERFHLP
jgi:hypothetical protein